MKAFFFQRRTAASPRIGRRSVLPVHALALSPSCQRARVTSSRVNPLTSAYTGVGFERFGLRPSPEQSCPRPCKGSFFYSGHAGMKENVQLRHRPGGRMTESNESRLVRAIGEVAGSDAGAWLRETIAAISNGVDVETLLRAGSVEARRRLRDDELGSRGPLLCAAQTALQTAHWTAVEAGRVSLVLAACAAYPEAQAAIARASSGRATRRSASHSSADSRSSRRRPRSSPLAREVGRTDSIPLFRALALRNPYPAIYYEEGDLNQMVLKALVQRAAARSRRRPRGARQPRAGAHVRGLHRRAPRRGSAHSGRHLARSRARGERERRGADDRASGARGSLPPLLRSARDDAPQPRGRRVATRGSSRDSRSSRTRPSSPSCAAPENSKHLRLTTESVFE